MFKPLTMMGFQSTRQLNRCYAFQRRKNSTPDFKEVASSTASGSYTAGGKSKSDCGGAGVATKKTPIWATEEELVEDGDVNGVLAVLLIVRLSGDLADTHVDEFEPQRVPGLHLPQGFVAESELSLFQLYFSANIITMLSTFTNENAWRHILEHPTYALPDGSWPEISAAEMSCFLAMLIYFGLILVSKADRYGSLCLLYHGLWPHRMLSGIRFRAIESFFQFSRSDDGDPDDRLRFFSEGA